MTELPFGAVLAEALSELDMAAARDVAFEAVERLSFGALQAVLTQVGGQLPRQGSHAYREGRAVLPSPPSQLDILY